MKIIQKIARKELKQVFRDKYFFTVGLSLYSFLLISLIINFLSFKEMAKAKDSARKAIREQWLNQGEVNPHGAAHFGLVVFKNRNPLSILDRGLLDYLGESIWLETHTRNPAEHAKIKDVNSFFRFGNFTPANILQYFFPLLIILVSYQSISGEKENNTLRLLLSTGLKPETLLLGKLLGLFYKLMLIYVPVILLLFFFVIMPFRNGQPMSFLLICLSYLLYFSVFALMSLSISALCTSSRKSLLLSLGFWITVGIFVPKMTAYASNRIIATPSTYEYSNDVERKYQYDFTEIYEEIQNELIQKEGVTSAEDLKENPFGYALEETEQRGQKIYEEVYGSIENLFYQQNTIHSYSGILSPLVNIRNLSMGLTRTDIQEHFNFNNAAEDYRRQTMNTLNMDIAKNSYYEQHDFVKKEITYTRNKDLWEKISEFDYEYLSTGNVVANHLQPLFQLTLWVLFAFLLLIFSFKKIKV